MSGEIRGIVVATGSTVDLAATDLGGGRGRLQVESSGGGTVIATPPDAVLFTSPGFVTSSIVSAVPSRPLQVMGRILVTAIGIRWVMLFNKATPLVNGDVPAVVPIQLNPGDPFAATFEPNVFTLGIGIASSSTDVTLTLAGPPSDLFFSLWSRV